MQLTPGDHAEQMREAQAAARREGEAALSAAAGRVSAAAREVSQALEQARTADRQNLRLVQVGTCGLVPWGVLAGPLARALPESWDMPEKMAAATLGMARWDAGVRLMASADPQRLRALVAADRFYRESEAKNAPGRARSKKPPLPK